MNEPTNNDELSQVVGHVAKLRVELRGLLRDIRSARREVEELRAEVRAETAALRADMATMLSRQNSRIEDNKKKLSGSLRVSAVSTGG
jgi:predicted  nucleic acid-binding Zn-ribbon protein